MTKLPIQLSSSSLPAASSLNWLADPCLRRLLTMAGLLFGMLLLVLSGVVVPAIELAGL